MSLRQEEKNRQLQFETRRHFLKTCTTGLGSMALASLVGCRSDSPIDVASAIKSIPNQLSHFAPKAKRVIYLHMAGAPSQLELFDYKPKLTQLHGEPCPLSFVEGKKFAFISGHPNLLGQQANFQQHGQSGAWISDLMPHLAKQADELCFMKAVHTDEFNHAPAQLMMHTGSPRLGKPSMGSWITYGLGSINENLPGYVVLVSGGKTPDAGKSIWGNGFLPSVYQGVQCRSQGDPVLYVSDPKGMSRSLRGKTIQAINEINQKEYEEFKDPEILTRISQYELAFKMQVSVPEAMDISKEPVSVHELYGTEPGKASFANNCLLARRLAERDVRFIQLFHWGWDAHGAAEEEALNGGFKTRCLETDQAIAGLIQDLKQRGMLEETLIVWGGEFGRTPMMENRDGVKMKYLGRDHQSQAFTMWMAGGGVKPGYTHGATDELGYEGVSGRVHVHDVQATILHTLGMNHEQLTYHFQGRNFRLTDQFGHVIKEVLT